MNRIPVSDTSGPEPAAAGRTFVIEMPAGLRLLNANQRPHWALRSRIVGELRKASFTIARRDRIPRLDRVRILVEYQPPQRTRSRDAGNWAPSGKALIDGIRDAKVIPDDNSRHVLEESYRIGEPFPLGRMVVYVTEVPAGTGGGT